MKTNAILIIAIIVLSYFLFKKENPKTVIKEKIEIAEICEYIDNTKPTKVEKVYIKLPSDPPKKEHKKVHRVVTDTVYTHKEVNKFVYKDNLKNGFLTATILADTIYQRDIEITTYEKTKTIEKMTFHPRIYLGGSLQSKKFKELNTASLNIYLAKQKSMLGVGYGYDLIHRHGLTNFTLAFKL